MDKIKEMLEEAGLPLAYDHFAEGESPDPPFLVFLSPGSENFGADDVVYADFPNVNVELYTDKKDPELEDTLEKIFYKHGIYWEKSETWINSEQMYEVLYQLTI